MTATTDGGPTGGGIPAPILCDFCGRSAADAGPMIEGKALVASGQRHELAHVCAQCAETCDGIFAKHRA